MNKMKKCLVMGCGVRDMSKEGCEMYYTDNIDRDRKNFTKANLNYYPYPFEDSSFDYIICEYVFEHLILKDKDKELWIDFFYEIERILKSGGELEFAVPHFSYPSTFQHSCYVSAEELWYIFYRSDEDDKNNWLREYFKTNLEIVNIKITLRKLWKPFEWLVNINRQTQWAYESYLACIFRGEFIRMRLRKK